MQAQAHTRRYNMCMCLLFFTSRLLACLPHQIICLWPSAMRKVPREFSEYAACGAKCQKEREKKQIGKKREREKQKTEKSLVSLVVCFVPPRVLLIVRYFFHTHILHACTPKHKKSKVMTNSYVIAFKCLGSNTWQRSTCNVNAQTNT